MELLTALIIYLVPATGTIVAGVTVASIIATGLILAGSLAFSMSQASKAKDKAREDYNAAQVDRLQNTSTTVGARELVMGRVRKGGPIGFRGSAGALKETFLAHISLADHEIDAVEAIYLNDEEVTLDGQGRVMDAPYCQTSRESRVISFASTGHYDIDGVTWVPGPNIVYPLVMPSAAFAPAIQVIVHITTQGSGAEGDNGTDTPVAFTLNAGGDYGAGASVTIPDWGSLATAELSYSYKAAKYYAKIWWSLGGDAVLADPRTEALFPTLWGPEYRGRGVAKLFAEFTFNETAFPTGGPLLTARIRGARIYDPRTGLTEWSENPALMMRHVYQHDWFGKADVSADEESRFIEAANACDINHGYSVGGVTENNPLYTAAIVIPYGTPAASAFKDLSAAMAGAWDYAGGELYLHAGVWKPPVSIILTDDDLAMKVKQGDSDANETLSITTHRERAEKINVMNGRIWDGGADFKLVALKPLRSQALIDADGGVELAQEVNLPAVSYAPQAKHVLGVMMRDARDPLMLEAPWKMRAYPLEIFDTVRVSLARYGFVLKTFRVMRRDWKHDRGVVRLAMKEVAAQIYTPDAAFDPEGYADNTSLPKTWDIDPPVLLAGNVFSGTAELVAQSDGTLITRVRVTWPELTDSRITTAGSVDISWRRVGETKWKKVSVDGDTNEGFIVGVPDRRVIFIRLRSRTPMAVSPWTDTITHTIVGKTALPVRIGTPVTATPEAGRIRLTWPPTVEADHRYFEWRTSDANWGQPGFALRSVEPTGLVDAPASGVTQTWYGRARDRSWNFSALSRSVSYQRLPPPNLGAITQTAIRGKISLRVPKAVATSFPIAGYEVRSTDSGWGTDGELWRGPSSRTPYMKEAQGLNSYFMRAYDDQGTYSLASVTTTHTFAVPATPTNLVLTRVGTQITAVVTAAKPADFKHFEFRFLKNGAGDVWATATDIVTSATPRATFRAPTLGAWRCSVRQVDIEENPSAASFSAGITLPRMPL